ncbi:MAG: hypothetical protein Q9208_003805 [Pyrenodesmia sp. 3 TL-2023]
MPLKSGACRLAATPLSAHVWISDDILNHASHRWTQLCIGNRYGSAIPGPLEACKRLAKRRMTEMRPTGGRLDLQPGFLAGLNQGQDIQQGWQWQSPTVPLPNGLPTGGIYSGSAGNARNADGTDDVPLPAWLTAPDAAAEESPSAAIASSLNSAGEVEIEWTLPTTSAEIEAQQRPRPSPVNELAQTSDLDEMRRIIGKIRAEKRPVRRKCSIVAFENLVRSGCETDRILEFLGDRTLNQRGARNLMFFVAYCLETSRVEEMRVLCKWVARQLFVGRYSDSALLLVLRSLFNVRQQSEWQSVMEDYCENVVQALRSSPVVHTEYLKLGTWSSFLGILLGDVHSERMLSLGVTFVNTSSSAQLDSFTDGILPLIELWISSRHPPTTNLGAVALTSKVTALLQSLRPAKLCEVVAAVSWRLLDHLASTDDYGGLWQRQSIWWCALRSPDIFQYLRESDSWSVIAPALQRRHDEDIASPAAAKIKEQLDGGNLGAAHSTMLQYPQISLDHCPYLAEALILNSERDAKTALEILQSRRPLVSVEVHNHPISKFLQHVQQDRIRLLERMASAYAQSSHIKPSFAFRCVYECCTLQKQENLGPITPAMARALVQTGIVRPLRSGRRLVSQARLDWILLQVAEAEGKDVMKKVGAAVWHWREKVIRQMQQQRNAKRESALGQQWHKQSTMRRGADYWDALKRMASAREPSPSKLRTPLEYHSPISKQRAEPRSFQVESRATTQRDISQHRNSPPSSSPVPIFSPEQDDPDPNEDDEDDEDEDDEDDDSDSEDDFDDDEFDPNQLPWAFKNSDTSTSAASVVPGLLSGRTGPSQPSPRINASINSTRHAVRHHGPVHRLDSLLKQLNVAPLIHSACTFKSPSAPSVDSLPELSPISPCSLKAAVDERRTAAEEAAKGFVIRRLIGIGQIHGAREGEEVTTLSTALQPAVGTGVGVLVGGSGLEGFGTGGWEC